MITLVVLKNPFNTDREIKKIDHIPGQPVFAYVQPEMMGHDEVVISRNGQIIPEDQYHSLTLTPGDFVAVCPVIKGGGGGDKNMGRIIASIAIFAIAGWAGGAIANAMYGGTWGFWSYVAAAGIQVAGGYLINKAFPYETPEDERETYGWGNTSPITTEGNAIPITFGTVRMGVMCPVQTLAQRVEANGEKQYLNLLLCGGEGPVDQAEDGEVVGISDIYINNQPIVNYGAVQVYKRAGLNDQPVIPYFGDTLEEQSLSYELELGGGWAVAQTLGNAGSGLEITLALPMGLCYRNDEGKVRTETVKIQAQYRKVEDEEWRDYKKTSSFGARRVTLSNKRQLIVVSREAKGKLPVGKEFYIVFSSGEIKARVTEDYQYTFDNGRSRAFYVDVDVPGSISAVKIYEDIIISAAQTTPLYRAIRMDQHIEVGQYEVRCRCIAKDGTSERHINTVYWTKLSHIIYDDFVRPNKVLLGIRALATDKLSGNLVAHWTQTRSKVWVWNPNINQYEQRNANNPAWACYDLIHRCKLLANTGEYEYVVKGVKPERIDYQSFLEWATYCDEKELFYNGIIHQTSSLWDALKNPEAAGRGKVLLRGTRYSCICDAPSQPVQMFNMSNIALDSFKEEFLGQGDRANALEISFFNIDKNYQQDTIVVYGDNYDESTVIQNPTQVSVPYAMTLAQAYRAGKYQLRLNQHLTCSASWEADIDAIACQVGDVVLVQHDVPEWGAGGGRVVTATENTVTLDQEVVLEPEQEYGLLVRLADDTLVQKKIQAVDEPTETATLAVTEAFEEIPQPDDMYSFGLYKREAKPFRLTFLSRDGDLRRKLVALEYNEAVYEEAEDIPEIDYTMDNPFFEVEGLGAAEETFRQKDGTMVSTIRATWHTPRNKKADEYYIYYSGDGGETWAWSDVVPENEHRIFGVKTGETYLVRVCVRIGPRISDGAISNEVYITGKDTPPSTVPKMTLTQKGTRIVVAITPVPDPDIRGYEIRLGPSWENSVLIESTDQPQTEFEAPNEGSLTFWVKAIDNSGNYSAFATVSKINIFGLPPKNIIFQREEDVSSWVPSNGSMYLNLWGQWKIQSKMKLRDYVSFFDMFGQPVEREENPELYLPVADLGPNIIEEGYFWVDRFGETHLNSVKKLRDFERFFDIFGVEHELVEPKYATQTLMGIEIYYNQSPTNRVDIEYRTRVDGDGWSSWKTYLEKSFFGRRIEVKLKPYTGNGENVAISGGRMVVDVPDVEEIIENVDIPPAKTRITFRRKFFDPPQSIAIFAADETGKQAIWRIDPGSVERDHFDLELLDDEGNLIAGKLLRASVRGY